MTEQEWLEYGELDDAMLKFAGNKASERKWRLFAVECCKRAWNLFLSEQSRIGVQVGEQFAEGLVNDDIRKKAHDEASLAVPEDREIAPPIIGCTTVAAVSCLSPSAHEGAWTTSIFTASAVGWTVLRDVNHLPANEASEFWNEESKTTRGAEFTAQMVLLRDIIGNPFRPITIDARWLTSTVVDLASVIYQERVFDRTPILADALMDAGCDNEEIIAHCRSEGPHVRGCWVVDLLLEKE